MRFRLDGLALAPALALACVAGACSSAQTSLAAPTADKCQLSVSGAPAAFPAAGGQGSLGINTSRDCTWSIAAKASWVSIAGDHGGQGETTVTFAVAPNPVPSSRSTAIVVGSQSVALSQAAAPCQFLAEPDGGHNRGMPAAGSPSTSRRGPGARGRLTARSAGSPSHRAPAEARAQRSGSSCRRIPVRHVSGV
jgi:hypothetical protein